MAGRVLLLHPERVGLVVGEAARLPALGDFSAGVGEALGGAAPTTPSVHLRVRPGSSTSTRTAEGRTYTLSVPSKFAIRTFGCQMNEHDSERLAGLLVADGMEPTDDLDDADLVVFNTCCIRENADNRLYGELGRLKELADQKPELKIAVGGCLAQKDRHLIRQRAPHVDVVFGTHNLARAPELLRRSAARGTDHRGDRRAGPRRAADAPDRPAPARASLRGVDHDPDRVRQLVCLLHRAVGPRGGR